MKKTTQRTRRLQRLDRLHLWHPFTQMKEWEQEDPLIIERALGNYLVDTDGNRFQRSGIDLEARIWQHEADHLDGRLITDNMSTTDAITNRRAVRQLEADYAASRRR